VRAAGKDGLCPFASATDPKLSNSRLFALRTERIEVFNVGLVARVAEVGSIKPVGAAPTRSPEDRRRSREKIWGDSNRLGAIKVNVG